MPALRDEPTGEDLGGDTDTLAGGIVETDVPGFVGRSYVFRQNDLPGPPLKIWKNHLPDN